MDSCYPQDWCPCDNKSCLSINIITSQRVPSQLPQRPESLSGYSNAKQFEPAYCWMQAKLPKKVFPVHLSVLLIKVVKFPLFWYLWDHLTRNVNKFYPFYVEIYPLITIPCSKGVDSGWHCKSSISNFANSFLTFKTCFDIFVLQNSPMVGPLLPTWWQSSMSLSDSATLAFVIALQTTSSRSV